MFVTDIIVVMKQVPTITITELTEMAEKMYGDLVKGVVDIKNGKLVVDAEMHVDEEQFLLESGSSQQDLWGINLYPSKYGQDDFVEFDSMINIRPRQNNMSRGVDDPKIRERIIQIVDGIVKA
jgi:Protein of unknown function (DUF5674)